MPSQSHTDASLIADLNDLLQLDHDAVEAYTLAIDVVRSGRYRDALVEHRADHKRHIEELAGLVRERGGLPTELPHPTAPLKLVVQALGAAPGDGTLLLAFKAVEGQARDKYQRFARNAYPADVSAIVKKAAEDESRHYQWAEGALRELGVGAGTIPHTVASAIEGLHKLLADPVEAAGRKVMEQVGNVVGTTRTRGGGAAPSPAAAASATVDTVSEAASDTASTVSAAAADISDTMSAEAADVADTAAGSTNDSAGADSATFIAALRAIEDAGDLEPMLALYDAASETTGPGDESPHMGREGARHFWHMYRESFTDIRSTFTNIVDAGDGTVMLEWTSAGTAHGGADVRYKGVSVVEMQGGRIRRFRTYYNPRDLDVGELRARPATSSDSSTRQDAELGGAGAA